MASSGQTDWHSLEQGKVLELLNADIGGLDEAEAQRWHDAQQWKRHVVQ